MMAAVVDPDFLELMPGDPDPFFRRLELSLGINYTNAGQICLIQGRYVLINNITVYSVFSFS